MRTITEHFGQQHSNRMLFSVPVWGPQLALSTFYMQTSVLEAESLSLSLFLYIIFSVFSIYIYIYIKPSGIYFSMLSCRCRRVDVRRELRDVTREEIVRFQQAVAQLQLNNEHRVWEQFRDLYMTHRMHASGAPYFLPWHRYFLRQLEQKLQEIDCTVVLPYFDFTTDVGNFSQAVLWQANFFGGNGNESDGGCVPDHPFGDPKAWEPCISRQFNTSVTLPTQVEIAMALASEDFMEMSMCLETVVAYVHAFVGGDMMTAGGPFDPVFYRRARLRGHAVLGLAAAGAEQVPVPSCLWEDSSHPLQHSAVARLQFRGVTVRHLRLPFKREPLQCDRSQTSPTTADIPWDNTPRVTGDPTTPGAWASAWWHPCVTGWCAKPCWCGGGGGDGGSGSVWLQCRWLWPRWLWQIRLQPKRWVSVWEKEHHLCVSVSKVKLLSERKGVWIEIWLWLKRWHSIAA